MPPSRAALWPGPSVRGQAAGAAAQSPCAPRPRHTGPCETVATHMSHPEPRVRPEPEPGKTNHGQEDTGDVAVIRSLQKQIRDTAEEEKSG